MGQNTRTCDKAVTIFLFCLLPEIEKAQIAPIANKKEQVTTIKNKPKITLEYSSKHPLDIRTNHANHQNTLQGPY